MILDEKWLNQKEWAKLSWEDGANISAWVKWKKPVSKEKMLKLALALWISEEKFNEIVASCAEEDLRIKTGKKNSDSIPSSEMSSELV